MRFSRPLSLFLTLLFLVSCFTVHVSASDSDNLINPVLTQWTKINSDYTVINKVANNSFDGGYWYQMYIKPEQLDTSVTLFQKYGGVYELGTLDSDSEYNFSLYLLDPTEMGYELTRYLSLFGDGVLYIGLAEYYGLDSNGLPDVRLLEEQIVSIDSSNYNRYFGKTININVTPPSTYSGSLCLTIQYVSYSETNTNVVPLGFANIVLNNETQAEEDSFFQRLFDWFEEKFDAIGESFSNLGNKLTELKNSFLDSLSNLGDTIGTFFDEQLEGIQEFFRGFANLILYFNWEGEYTNPFEREESPIDKVSEFFDNLIEYVDSIGTSIENVLDSITGGLHIFDEFTSRFPWLKGIAVFCLALIVITRFIGL